MLIWQKVCSEDGRLILEMIVTDLEFRELYLKIENDNF